MKKIALIVIFVFVVLSTGCSSVKIQNEKMIKKYSDDNNYVALSGEIVECDGDVVIIKCEELKNYLSYEDDICEYMIYADQSLELVTGDKIDFITVPYHFYNGHYLPIVEVKKDDNILLHFNEGKKILIESIDLK